MDKSIFVVGGVAAGLWALMSGKSSQTPIASAKPSQIAAQAVAAAKQAVANGTPPDQAAALAAMNVQIQIGKLPPPPPPIMYSPTPVATTPTGPIVSLSDPRIAQAIANKDAMFGAEISAAGMPLDVRNALVAQGWTWNGSVFNPGGLYPPGTDPSKMMAVA